MRHDEPDAWLRSGFSLRTEPPLPPNALQNVMNAQNQLRSASGSSSAPSSSYEDMEPGQPAWAMPAEVPLLPHGVSSRHLDDDEDEEQTSPAMELRRLPPLASPATSQITRPHGRTMPPMPADAALHIAMAKERAARGMEKAICKPSPSFYRADSPSRVPSGPTLLRDLTTPMSDAPSESTALAPETPSTVDDEIDQLPSVFERPPTPHSVIRRSRAPVPHTPSPHTSAAVAAANMSMPEHHVPTYPKHRPPLRRTVSTVTIVRKTTSRPTRPETPSSATTSPAKKAGKKASPTQDVEKETRRLSLTDWTAVLDSFDSFEPSTLDLLGDTSAQSRRDTVTASAQFVRQMERLQTQDESQDTVLVHDDSASSESVFEAPLRELPVPRQPEHTQIRVVGHSLDVSTPSPSKTRAVSTPAAAVPPASSMALSQAVRSPPAAQAPQEPEATTPWVPPAVQDKRRPVPPDSPTPPSGANIEPTYPRAWETSTSEWAAVKPAPPITAPPVAPVAPAAPAVPATTSTSDVPVPTTKSEATGLAMASDASSPAAPSTADVPAQTDHADPYASAYGPADVADTHTRALSPVQSVAESEAPPPPSKDSVWQHTAFWRSNAPRVPSYLRELEEKPADAAPVTSQPVAEATQPTAPATSTPDTSGVWAERMKAPMSPSLGWGGSPTPPSSFVRAQAWSMAHGRKVVLAPAEPKEWAAETPTSSASTAGPRAATAAVATTATDRYEEAALDASTMPTSSPKPDAEQREDTAAAPTNDVLPPETTASAPSTMPSTPAETSSTFSRPAVETQAPAPAPARPPVMPHRMPPPKPPTWIPPTGIEGPWSVFAPPVEFPRLPIPPPLAPGPALVREVPTPEPPSTGSVVRQEKPQEESGRMSRPDSNPFRLSMASSHRSRPSSALSDSTQGGRTAVQTAVPQLPPRPAAAGTPDISMVARGHHDPLEASMQSEQPPVPPVVTESVPPPAEAAPMAPAPASPPRMATESAKPPPTPPKPPRTSQARTPSMPLTAAAPASPRMQQQPGQLSPALTHLPTSPLLQMLGSPTTMASPTPGALEQSPTMRYEQAPSSPTAMLGEQVPARMLTTNAPASPAWEGQERETEWVANKIGAAALLTGSPTTANAFTPEMDQSSWHAPGTARDPVPVPPVPSTVPTSPVVPHVEETRPSEGATPSRPEPPAPTEIRVPGAYVPSASTHRSPTAPSAATMPPAAVDDLSRSETPSTHAMGPTSHARPRTARDYPGMQPQHSMIPPFELQNRSLTLPANADPRRPGGGVCLECMMRDEDMIDVTVTDTAVWERQSDADFQEALRIEQAFCSPDDEHNDAAATLSLVHPRTGRPLTFVPVRHIRHGDPLSAAHLQEFTAANRLTSAAKARSIQLFVLQQRRILGLDTDGQRSALAALSPPPTGLTSPMAPATSTTAATVAPTVAATEGAPVSPMGASVPIPMYAAGSAGSSGAPMRPRTPTGGQARAGPSAVRSPERARTPRARTDNPRKSNETPRRARTPGTNSARGTVPGTPERSLTHGTPTRSPRRRADGTTTPSRRGDSRPSTVEDSPHRDGPRVRRSAAGSPTSPTRRGEPATPRREGGATTPRSVRDTPTSQRRVRTPGRAARKASEELHAAANASVPSNHAATTSAPALSPIASASASPVTAAAPQTMDSGPMLQAGMHETQTPGSATRITSPSIPPPEPVPVPEAVTSPGHAATTARPSAMATLVAPTKLSTAGGRHAPATAGDTTWDTSMQGSAFSMDDSMDDNLKRTASSPLHQQHNAPHPSHGQPLRGFFRKIAGRSATDDVESARLRKSKNAGGGGQGSPDTSLMEDDEQKSFWKRISRSPKSASLHKSGRHVSSSKMRPPPPVPPLPSDAAAPVPESPPR